MANSFDDMPEIELDEIVDGAGAGKKASEVEDEDAIDFDFGPGPPVPRKHDPSAPPTSVSALPEARIDDDAIDLGLDFAIPEPASPGPEKSALADLANLDSDVLSQQVEQSAGQGDPDAPLLPSFHDEPEATPGADAAAPPQPPPQESFGDLDDPLSALGASDSDSTLDMTPEEPDSLAKTTPDLNALGDEDLARGAVPNADTHDEPLDDFDDELDFKAEHEPIGGRHSEPGTDPLTISPTDDPEAPALPLAYDEPAAVPKVPLEALRPDSKTLDTLRRLAGPAGSPEKARRALTAALNGERYDPRELPELRAMIIGVARQIVEQGVDADRLVQKILDAMME